MNLQSSCIGPELLDLQACATMPCVSRTVVLLTVRCTDQQVCRNADFHSRDTI